MTSEPDSTPRRRPPTIDLTAEEIGSERQASSEANSAADDAAKDHMTQRGTPGERGGRSFFRRAAPYAVGAAAGAIVVGAIIAGFWRLAGAPAQETALPPSAAQVPAPATQATAPAAVASTAAADDISSRLDKIQQALQSPRPDETLAARVTAAEAQTKSLGDSLTALTRRVDEVSAAAQSVLVQAKAAAAAAAAAKSAAQASIQRGDIDALATRVTTLESALKSLSADLAQDVAQHSSSADDRAARATVAAEALRAAVERGAPYQAELAAVQSLGADQNATAPLAPFAAEGIPSAAALGRELSALTPALQRASGTAPKEDSFLGRLQAHAQQLVRVTPLDAPTGDDPSSVIARLNADAARGDIAAALADIQRLPEKARSVAESWVKKAAAREQAIAASRRLATDALAAIGSSASQ
jgi:hypothetical protein